MSTKAKAQDTYRSFGDAMNYAGIITNILVTSAAMTGTPAGAYDAWWLGHGFCVNQNSDRAIDTEVLCFVVLAGSSVLLYVFNEQTTNPQLQAKMSAGIFANFAHGFGHLFLFLLGSAPPPMEFAMTPAAIGNIVMLFCFWVGVLKAVVISLNNNHAAIAATVVLATQHILNVPPGLAFTYSQSVILLAGAFDQLRIPKKEKGFTYLAVATSYVPLFVLYVIEMTHCTDVLASFGGHAVYDTYLAIMPFLLFYSVRYHEQGSLKKPKIA
jgi:hypothetical protein